MFGKAFRLIISHECGNTSTRTWNDTNDNTNNTAPKISNRIATKISQFDLVIVLRCKSIIHIDSSILLYDHSKQLGN